MNHDVAGCIAAARLAYFANNTTVHNAILPQLIETKLPNNEHELCLPHSNSNYHSRDDLHFDAQSNQDTTTFDAFSFSPPASLTSSYASSSSNESASSSISKSQISGLSRSRCVGNLSALGGAASETSTKRRKVAKSGPNQGWGYFVDTPDQKK